MLLPISPQDLAARLGAPDAPLIVDVRLPEDIAERPGRSPGALRVGHRDVTLDNLCRATDDRPPPDDVVVICHRGQKLSLGAAARLHSDGARARILAGGMVAWYDAALPVTPDTGLPASNFWVCAEDPNEGAALSHWILRRFAPPGAQLLTVPGSGRAAVAARFDAREIESPETLARDLGLDLPALHGLIRDCAAPGPIARLLRRAATGPDQARTGSPALLLLDLAFAESRAGVPA